VSDIRESAFSNPSDRNFMRLLDALDGNT